MTSSVLSGILNLTQSDHNYRNFRSKTSLVMFCCGYYSIETMARHDTVSHSSCNAVLDVDTASCTERLPDFYYPHFTDMDMVCPVVNSDVTNKYRYINNNAAFLNFSASIQTIQIKI